MAIIRSGVLGNTRGKVAGVVGSQWKDQNYLREYVKPANPNTAAQQVQRSLMSNCVAFCKPLVGPVFNEFTDKFLKHMSGFNYFIKSNIAEFVAVPTWSNIKVTEGKLYQCLFLTCTYDTADGGIDITWPGANGNNGSDSDLIYWIAYDKSTGLWYFQDACAARDTESDDQTIVSGLTAANLQFWMWAVQKTGAIVTMISNSDHMQASAP